MNSRKTVLTVAAASFGLLAVGALASQAAGSGSEPSAESAVLGSETHVRVPDPDVAASRRSAGGPARARHVKHLRGVFNIETRRKVFFITIDDGFTKNAAALRLIQKYKLPVTVFLTNAAAAGNYRYFEKVAAFGGSVENHTMTHPVLPSVSDSKLKAEICGPQRIYERRYGSRPTMLRPPYGEGGYSASNSSARRRIDRVATSCGLQYLVMWNAVSDRGRFQFIKGSLHKGDIVLFHFTPSLDQELRAILAMARSKGLTPAVLGDYLPVR